mmetsp:Transcript_65295/g.156062  ORF Transcript_65295/g.156062 Transcript_65295/m.156062 type:complete len:113 (+) Transcript_65295:1235-1573(+)
MSRRSGDPLQTGLCNLGSAKAQPDCRWTCSILAYFLRGSSWRETRGQWTRLRKSDLQRFYRFRGCKLTFTSRRESPEVQQPPPDAADLSTLPLYILSFEHVCACIALGRLRR